MSNLDEINKALLYIAKRMPAAIDETKRLMSEPRLSLSITRWHELRRLDAELKAVRSALTTFLNVISDDLMPAQLDAEKLRSAPHALGTVKIAHHFRATQVGDRAAIHKWLKDHQLGALVVPTVNARTLASALKEPFQKGELTPPADLIKCSVRRYASLTGETDDGDE